MFSYIIFSSMPNTKITSTYGTLSEVISFKTLTNVPKFAGPRVLKFNQIFLFFVSGSFAILILIFHFPCANCK